MMEPLDLTVNLVRKTGQVLLNFYHNKKFFPALKSDFTVITEADLEADRMLREEIKRAFPADSILSEEENTTYLGGASPTWVIDPLDGTSNFSLGIHYWGISVARVVDGWPDLGVLYFPVFDELYTAQRGKGAFLNGNPIHPKYSKDQPAVFFTCCSRTHRRYQLNLRIKPRIIGSAAYNFCAVASGRSIVGFEATPKIWDLAASWLVLSEAGGFLLPFEESPFPLFPGKNYEKISFPTLAAATDPLLTEAKGKIKKIQ